MVARGLRQRTQDHAGESVTAPYRGPNRRGWRRKFNDAKERFWDSCWRWYLRRCGKPVRPSWHDNDGEPNS